MISPDIDIHASAEIIRHIKAWKTSAYIPLPSEWAAENRYLPAGTTEFPGYVDHSIAPHMVEIQDCFHPDSGIKCVSIMKSTQSLATTTLENVIGHSIKYKLHNILYIISSRNIAKVRSSAAIDVMIDNSGLAEYVKPMSQRMKRKVADNTFYKEFAGGRRLMMTSYNSIADAKSLSWDLIIMDEIDEAPYELKGQGDPEKIFEGRGKTVRGLKIAKISTPTNMHGRINQNFLNGDRRFFFCQCPLCGELQVLVVFGIDGADYGLRARAEKIDGIEQVIPDSVNYVCKFCHREIYEYQKQDMLTGGKWVPTSRPVNPEYRSYHISNLMSPIVFYTWRQCMQEYAETDWGQNVMKYKNYKIDVLGQPWETKAEKKDWRELQQRAEEYQLGMMPPGALIPIAGYDVQKRWIECTVWGFGRGLECWVLDHVKFHAETETKNRDDRCWQDFRNFVLTKKYKLRDRELPIAINAIDSGYNPEGGMESADISQEHTVYEIVARTPRTIACRGNAKLKDTVIREERVKRQSPLKIRYDVATNEIKNELFVRIDLPPGAPGAMHFSKYLSEDFFRGFLSEVFTEIEPGKWGYKKIFERNEPLDNYIDARAGAEALNLPTWTDKIWDEYEKRLIG